MSQYGRGQEPNRGGYRPGAAPTAQAFPMPTEQQLKAIIEAGDAKVLVESALALGSALASPSMGLTTSQIRGVFGTVRQIEMKWPYGEQHEPEARVARRQLLLLKPKLAYQATRAQGQGVDRLQQVLAPAIDLVTTREQFSHLVDYFEAILAYHKAKGGRD